MSITAISFACAALFLTQRTTNEAARVYFSAALRAARASSTVIVSGRSYSVVDGEVSSDGPVSRSRQLSALKIAYALSMARATPPLGIAGVEPAALSAAAAHLDAATEKLARVQDAPHDSALIRDALYPTAYLFALAKLEERRRDLMSTGSDTDLLAYDEALRAAVSEGKRASKTFSDALQATIGTSTATLSYAGGSLPMPSLLSWSRAVQTQFSAVESEITQRHECAAGNISDCDQSDLRAPIPLPLPRPSAAQALALAADISTVYTEAFGRPASYEAQPVVLNESACVSALPGPYVFELGILRHQPRFVGNIIFQKTESSNGDVVSYLSEELGITYLMANPAVYYQCPDVLSDLSRIKATILTAAFARAHSSVAERIDSMLLSDGQALYEADARAYVRDTLSRPDVFNTMTQDDRDGLIALARMFAEERAGLDIVTEQIATTIEQDIAIRSSGSPFDLSARTMFLTHSAFPSLLSLAAVPSFKDRTQSTARYFEAHVPYSRLKDSVSREKIISDMKRFQEFEQQL